MCVLCALHTALWDFDVLTVAKIMMMITMVIMMITMMITYVDPA